VRVDWPKAQRSRTVRSDGLVTMPSPAATMSPPTPKGAPCPETSSAGSSQCGSADPAAKVGDHSDRTNRVGTAHVGDITGQGIVSMATIVVIERHTASASRETVPQRRRLKRYVHLMSPYCRQPCTGKGESLPRASSVERAGSALELRLAPEARGGGARSATLRKLSRHY
jgi:hypothetical protein